MRKISANYVFPVSGPPIKNGIIILDDNNTIIEIKVPVNNHYEESNLEYYNGILVPGFVNTHCHLELSGLKNKIQQGLGMTEFIQAVRRLRQTEDENPYDAIERAHKEMVNQGIVLVADVSNTTATIPVKKQNDIKYLTFIELLGLNKTKNAEIIAKSLNQLHAFHQNKLEATLTPHALYSLNAPLFHEILTQNVKSELPLSIHHMESHQEFEYLAYNSGELKTLMETINENNPIPTEGLFNYEFLSYITPNKKILFVHNLCINNKLPEKVKQQLSQIFWVLCPSSNLYIHKQMPPVEYIDSFTQNICLGTDSLSSNQRLSVLNELKTLLSNNPWLTFEKSLKWATLSGAIALGQEHLFGSFEVGKNPGINLLSPFDFKQMTLTTHTQIKKLA